MKNIMGCRNYLVLTHVLIWIVQESPRCANLDMQVHAGASLVNIRVQSGKNERIFPKSCAAICSDHEGCLGASVDKETDMRIFHYGNEDGITCPSLVSTEFETKLQQWLSISKLMFIHKYMCRHIIYNNIIYDIDYMFLCAKHCNPINQAFIYMIVHMCFPKEVKTTLFCNS